MCEKCAPIAKALREGTPIPAETIKKLGKEDQRLLSQLQRLPFQNDDQAVMEHLLDTLFGKMAPQTRTDEEVLTLVEALKRVYFLKHQKSQPAPPKEDSPRLRSYWPDYSDARPAGSHC
jgi:hypothetical protein